MFVNLLSFSRDQGGSPSFSCAEFRRARGGKARPLWNYNPQSALAANRVDN